MNQLAMAIRSLSDDGKDTEHSNLTPLELIVLRSISGMLKMAPVDLASYLKQEGEPTEWLIIPPVITATKEVD